MEITLGEATKLLDNIMVNCDTQNFISPFQNFYAELNFASRNLLDSAAGGTFI